jgi:hypothetical protein
LIVQLSKADVDVYLENRRQKGFNTILVNLIEHFFATNPPRNFYGDAPFLTTGDFATPNEAYFAHAEYVIATAAQKGMLVLLTPAYMGVGGGSQGWYQEMQANGATKLRAYGQYLANRFLAHDNILWVHGGDFSMATGTRPRWGSWGRASRGCRSTTSTRTRRTSWRWHSRNTPVRRCPSS